MNSSLRLCRAIRHFVICAADFMFIVYPRLFINFISASTTSCYTNPGSHAVQIQIAAIYNKKSFVNQDPAGWHLVI
ncbi:hypothetical protein K439DRAFT_749012 [Ramaria rubella]|nr:hypothetical protein K439DRAFT_749012 [Ramaria rubella]